MNNIEYKDDVKNTSLPKWPAFVVTGERITEEQAAEICIKTDSTLPSFRYASNDKGFEQELCDLFGLPYDDDGEDFNDRWAKVTELRTRLGKIDLHYLNNSRIVSAFIGGPHGWCDWDGNIFCNSFNIGKWPDVEDVAEDWAKIAEAFPFLNLRSHLYNAETSEGGVPVVEFVVEDGHVVVQKPTTTLAPPVSNITGVLMGLFGNPYRERGIHITLLRQKLETVYGEIPQYE